MASTLVQQTAGLSFKPYLWERIVLMDPPHLGVGGTEMQKRKPNLLFTGEPKKLVPRSLDKSILRVDLGDRWLGV